MTVDGFIPGPSNENPITEEVLAALRPDLSPERIRRSWLEFSAFRQRVRCPWRRNSRAFAKIDNSVVLFRPPMSIPR